MCGHKHAIPTYIGLNGSSNDPPSWSRPPRQEEISDQSAEQERYDDPYHHHSTCIVGQTQGIQFQPPVDRAKNPRIAERRSCSQPNAFDRQPIMPKTSRPMTPGAPLLPIQQAAPGSTTPPLPAPSSHATISLSQPKKPMPQLTLSAPPGAFNPSIARARIALG